MAGNEVKGSLLPTDGSPTTDDYMFTVDGGGAGTKKITLAQLASLLSNNLTANNIDKNDINWTTAGGIWWEELARTTLAVAGDTLSCTFTGKKYLMFLAEIVPTGGSNTSQLRFNGDSGSNYGFRYTIDNGLGSGSDSANNVGNFSGTGTQNSTIIGQITNIAGRPKLGVAHTLNNNGATRPNYVEFYFGWNNTSALLTTLNFFNAGAGDFAIGSELVILGHD